MVGLPGIIWDSDERFFPQIRLLRWAKEIERFNAYCGDDGGGDGTNKSSRELGNGTWDAAQVREKVFSHGKVYLALFRPLKVNRHQFKKVLNCMKLIRQLKYQEVYAQERATKVDSLSLVLSGK
ncbi:hypothetical protein RUM44_012487 [Polyplax serrata]|uniref:Uncharacterized protein n=1 Tax=Polyplax serrata TaxID=468196 RepID=A0ABR1BFV2_POLSC